MSLKSQMISYMLSGVALLLRNIPESHCLQTLVFLGLSEACFCNSSYYVEYFMSLFHRNT